MMKKWLMKLLETKKLPRDPFKYEGRDLTEEQLAVLRVTDVKPVTQPLLREKRGEL